LSWQARPAPPSLCRGRHALSEEEFVHAVHLPDGAAGVRVEFAVELGYLGRRIGTIHYAIVSIVQRIVHLGVERSANLYTGLV